MCDIFKFRLHELQKAQRNYVTTNLKLDIILDRGFTYENNTCNCRRFNQWLHS